MRALIETFHMENLSLVEGFIVRLHQLGIAPGDGWFELEGLLEQEFLAFVEEPKLPEGATVVCWPSTAPDLAWAVRVAATVRRRVGSRNPDGLG